MITIKPHTSKVLGPLVKSFWYLKVSEDLDKPYTEEILPDGHHEIVFHYNSTASRKRGGGESWIHDPCVFFAGQNRKAYTQRLSPGAILYAIRFYPHTQTLLYDFPAFLSTDNFISLDEISSKDSLPACLCESPEKTFALLEKELVKKVSRLKNPGVAFSYVDAAVRAIINLKGNVKIEWLEKMTGVSARHLEKSFLKYVGLSPKHFCNLMRFNHFVNIRRHHPEKNLTECAHAAEFYDQSHLNYLSYRITGKSSKQFFSQPDYINDFFLNA